MPYKVTKVNGGCKVTTPNHPGGMSKKPLPCQTAYKQKSAIEHSTGENDAGEKVRPAHEEWANKVKGHNRRRV